MAKCQSMIMEKPWKSAVFSNDSFHLVISVMIIELHKH